MAKGFTVKAKTPTTQKKPEWDYDKARELIKGKSVVFCLPGRGVSFTFLKAFVIQTKSYHIYLNDKCLFKNLNEEEFHIIWSKLYTSYCCRS